MLTGRKFASEQSVRIQSARLLTFVASYWLTFIIFFLQKGNPLAANWVSDSLALFGFMVAVFARLSLGRNIAFVPAQRKIVHSGAYAFAPFTLQPSRTLVSSFVLTAHLTHC